MLCNNCGKEVPENAQFCPYCGSELIEEVFEPTNEVYDQGQPENQSKTLLMGSIGVFLSFLFFFGIPFVHIIGIFLGRQGIIYANQDKQYSSYYSKNGLLLSWIAVILGIFGIVINVVYMILNPESLNA